jgi:sugar O-acyltransferase (sialic acid O-acetyltransferase NeuD family)
VRLALGDELAASRWRLPAIVDPAAQVAEDVRVGAGTYIGAAVVVQPGARVGPFCIVNTGAIVEHDAGVGAGVHLAPRTCLAGHAEIRCASFVGVGAIVRDRVRIIADVIVGMGAVAVADIADGVVAYGNPARVVRKNQL